MESEILKEAVDIAGEKVTVALALVGQGRAMKAVCAALAAARSNVHLQAMRADDWIDGRTARAHDPVSYMMPVDAVHAEIVSLLT